MGCLNYGCFINRLLRSSLIWQGSIIDWFSQYLLGKIKCFLLPIYLPRKIWSWTQYLPLPLSVEHAMYTSTRVSYFVPASNIRHYGIENIFHCSYEKINKKKVVRLPVSCVALNDTRVKKKGFIVSGATASTAVPFVKLSEKYCLCYFSMEIVNISLG